jgi:16S rRNA (guanine(966)-N(2))-methyltransferase RsmD
MSFLDLFAGSGLVGIEAASRGASRIVFVEKDPGKRATLEANLSFVTASTKVLTMAAEVFVRRWKEDFDLIFLDPPFPYAYKQDLLERVSRSKLVKPDTKILSTSPRKPYSRRGGKLEAGRYEGVRKVDREDVQTEKTRD